MFIQVITGKASDPEAVHRQMEIWERDLMPGAIGYLGSTGGCTSTGDCIMVVRFESADAARQNSERADQSRWWAETEQCFDGPVRFHDSEDVAVMMHGDLDQAHFVQVMEGHVTDRERADALEREADEVLTEARPDLLGSVTAYFDGKEFTELAYFTTEADARERESQALPDDAAERFAEWEHVMKVERWMDIADPWLVKA